MYTYETLRVGDAFSASRAITAEDAQTFARVIGLAPSVGEDPTRRSRCGRPAAHGLLLLGLVSKVLGRDFPGHGSVAVDLSCRFLRPVPVGSEVTVEVQITEKIEKRKYVRAHVYVRLDGRAVLDGEGTVLPPSEEKGSDALIPAGRPRRRARSARDSR